MKKLHCSYRILLIKDEHVRSWVISGLYSILCRSAYIASSGIAHPLPWFICYTVIVSPTPEAVSHDLSLRYLLGPGCSVINDSSPVGEGKSPVKPSAWQEDHLTRHPPGKFLIVFQPSYQSWIDGGGDHEPWATRPAAPRSAHQARVVSHRTAVIYNYLRRWNTKTAAGFKILNFKIQRFKAFSSVSKYRKPRISRIQVDQQIYPSYEKIRLMRSEIKWFGTNVRQISSEICGEPTYANPTYARFTVLNSRMTPSSEFQNTEIAYNGHVYNGYRL